MRCASSVERYEILIALLGFVLRLGFVPSLELEARKEGGNNQERNKDPEVVGKNVKDQPVLEAVVARVPVLRGKLHQGVQNGLGHCAKATGRSALRGRSWQSL